MTPHQAIRSAIDATDHGRWRIDYDDAAMRIMENMAAAGFQVVTNDPQWDVIAAVADAAWFEPDDAKEAIGRLRERGYQVVTNDLVRNAESYLEATRSGESLYGIPLYVEANLKADALAASLAAHRGDDPLNVFREGGA